MAKSAKWIERGRAHSPDAAPLDVTLGIPTFIGDTLKAARETARQNLALYTTFPFFQRLFRASGFAEEADRMEQGEGFAALSNRLLDAICLLGPPSRCQEQLQVFRQAGVNMPILAPPAGVKAAQAVIQAFARG